MYNLPFKKKKDLIIVWRNFHLWECPHVDVSIGRSEGHGAHQKSRTTLILNAQIVTTVKSAGENLHVPVSTSTWADQETIITKD